MTGLKAILHMVENQCHLSPGTLAIDERTGAVTATQIISQDRTTYNTCTAIQQQGTVRHRAIPLWPPGLDTAPALDLVDGTAAILTTPSFRGMNRPILTISSKNTSARPAPITARR